MQPETNLLLEQLDLIDNDCKDALIAKWGEKDFVKKQILVSIYKKRNMERSKLIQGINKLCQIQ